jgi:multidrug efflux system membrane fusion protein
VRELQRKNPLAVEAFLPGNDKITASGRIAFLDNAVDQTTGTIKVRAVFDNADVALWPGQFVSVRVRLYDEADAILVPSRALQTGPAGQFVYVIKDDSTVEIRKVNVSRNEGEMAVVSGGGLAKGERVVVRGALRLAPGAKVNVMDGAAKPDGPAKSSS